MGYYAWWLVPTLVIASFMLPGEPAPQATVIKPADPFENVQIVTKPPRMKALTFRKMPVPIDTLK